MGFPLDAFLEFVLASPLFTLLLLQELSRWIHDHLFGLALSSEVVDQAVVAGNLVESPAAVSSDAGGELECKPVVLELLQESTDYEKRDKIEEAFL